MFENYPKIIILYPNFRGMYAVPMSLMAAHAQWLCMHNDDTPFLFQMAENQLMALNRV